MINKKIKRFPYYQWIKNRHELLGKQIKKVNQNNQNNYIFRGKLNLTQLCNDAQEDNHLAFIAITPDITYFGLSKCLPIDQTTPLEYHALFSPTPSSFTLFSTDKKYTHKIIALIKKKIKLYKKEKYKLRRQIKKQNNSNKPVTKIITF